MNTVEYTFQSPYSSPFQVGRVDFASAKENTQNDTTPKENKVEQDSSITSIFSSEQQLQELQIMDNNSTSPFMLDTYA